MYSHAKSKKTKNTQFYYTLATYHVWKACILKAGVQLSLTSPDGDEGYPGTVDVTVSYSLDNQKTLTISYAASTNASTLINLTSHSYFNLRGAVCEK